MITMGIVVIHQDGTNPCWNQSFRSILSIIATATCVRTTHYCQVLILYQQNLNFDKKKWNERRTGTAPIQLTSKCLHFQHQQRQSDWNCSSWWLSNKPTDRTCSVNLHNSVRHMRHTRRCRNQSRQSEDGKIARVKVNRVFCRNGNHRPSANCCCCRWCYYWEHSPLWWRAKYYGIIQFSCQMPENYCN